MTTALYRRYRPDTFDEVIGQDHVTVPLRAALRANRVTHAYLFSGPRGCGKTTSARILARCLNCAEGPTDTPCGHCDSCRELATGGPGSLDVVEMDAASHGGVDDARDLRERAAFAPVRDRYKVFIIDEAHMVTPQGFNALLKLVEEPPEHVKFVFATTEPEKVIGTIRSRTHHYPFRLVPPDVLEPYLRRLCDQEGIAVGDGVLGLVIRAGGGSVRDTLSVLDQLMAGSTDGRLDYATTVALLGYTDTALLDQTVDALAGGDGAAVYRVVERMVESGHEPRRFVEDLLQRLRDLLIIAVAGDGADDVLAGTPADQLERMRVQARNWGPGPLSRAADLTDQALRGMTGATSPRLQLELLIGRILVPEPGRSAAGEPAAGAFPGTVGLAGGGAPHGSSAAAGVPSSPIDEGGASGARFGATEAREQLRRARAGQDGEQRPASVSSGGAWAPDPVPAPGAPASASAGVSPSPASAGGAWAPDAGPAAAAASAACADSDRAGRSRPQPTNPSSSSASVPAGGSLPGWDEPVAAVPAGGASAADASATAAAPRSVDAQRPSPVPAEAHAGGGSPAAEQAMPVGPTSPHPAPTDARGDGPASALSASPAPTGAEPSGSASGRDADMLRDRWAEVVQRLASISRATWSLVDQNGQLGGVDGATAVVVFPTAGLVGAFTAGNRGPDLERAIHEATGLALSVRAQVGQAGGGAPVTTPTAAAARPAPSDPRGPVPSQADGPRAVAPQGAAAAQNGPQQSVPARMPASTPTPVNPPSGDAAPSGRASSSERPVSSERRPSPGGDRTPSSSSDPTPSTASTAVWPEPTQIPSSVAGPVSVGEGPAPDAAPPSRAASPEAAPARSWNGGWTETVAIIPGAAASPERVPPAAPVFEDDDEDEDPDEGLVARTQPPARRWERPDATAGAPSSAEPDDAGPEPPAPHVAAAQDTSASIDDADIASSTLIGLPAVLEILGGQVIDEIPEGED